MPLGITRLTIAIAEHQMSRSQKPTARSGAIGTLLSRKQQLLARLERGPSPDDQDIQNELRKTDVALNWLDRPDRAA